MVPRLPPSKTDLITEQHKPRERRRIVMSCSECHRRKQKVGSPTKELNKKPTKDWIVRPPVSMLQLHQARSAGIYTSKRNIAFGLIGDRRIFAIMTLDRREAEPREAVPVRVVPRKSAVAPIWCICARLLDRALSGLASFRTGSETLDIPAMAITTP